MSESETEDVQPEEIHHLLDFFSKKSYRANGDQRNDPVTEKCIKLFSRDYQISVINNSGGVLCSHYPSKLVLQEYQKNSTDAERVESMYDANKIRELYKLAKFARCRSRVVVPVIMFEGKHVCRSATLSSGAEMYSRSGLDFFFTGGEQPSSSNSGSSSSSTPRSPSTDSQSDMQMFDQVRGSDIELLKTFSVKYIVDLMMEKKKVKFGMNITSSEKVDKKNRYGEFCILSIPYPGCEFFREWKDNSYLGELMKFDWSQSTLDLIVRGQWSNTKCVRSTLDSVLTVPTFELVQREQGYVDAQLDIPQTELLSQLTTDWSQYTQWNLIQLTQNYLKMLIHMLTKGDRGILVHCISGWDRTPMFISLLRLSLWADGAIHKSLSASEILYLTLAYDWYLFGHSLSDRLSKGEEILLFCFYFLTYITSDEYSVSTARSSKARCTSAEGHHSSQMCSQETRHQNHGSCSSSSSHASMGRRRNASSSSLSSTGSFSVEPPSSSMFYMNCDEEEEDLVQPVTACLSGSRLDQRCSPVAGGANLLQSGSPHQSQSSPVNVPSSRARQTGMSASPCGSWQVISNTGSLLSSEAHSNPARTGSNISTCEEVTERWEKLDTVRRIFYNAYNNKISAKMKPDSSLTNLFDHFAEKVGIRPFKGFY